ncbi:MAG: MFS transporter [Devosia sp.]
MTDLPRWRLAALSLAMLLPSLGISIANVVLPSLATSFAASFQDVQWVVIAYLLAVTTLIVSAGRLGDMFGRRRLLLIGIGLFAIASAVCAIAPNLWTLLAGRAVQGMGAAIMMALTVALVADAVPKERTGSAVGLLGTVSAVGTALGPSLGGALLAWFGWPAVFVFMAVTAAITLVFGVLLLPADRPGSRMPAAFDVVGTILLALSLGAYALSTSLSSALSGISIALLAGLAALGLLAFFAHERRTPSPLIRMDLLRDSALNAGLVTLALVSAIVMATLVVGPFYLSTVLGLSPVHAGLVMSIGPAVAALVGVPAGRLVDRVGPPTVTIAGLVGVAAGSVLMTLLPGWFGVTGYVTALAVITAGYALFQAANNTAIMNTATGELRGVTSALLGLSRNLGLITGASAMGALFALGSRGVALWGLDAGGGEAGMRLAFAVATAGAALAILVAAWGIRSRPQAAVDQMAITRVE